MVQVLEMVRSNNCDLSTTVSIPFRNVEIDFTAIVQALHEFYHIIPTAFTNYIFQLTFFCYINENLKIYDESANYRSVFGSKRNEET